MPKLLVHTICCLTLDTITQDLPNKQFETLPTGSHWVTFIIIIPKSAFSETQNSIIRVTKSGCGLHVQHFSLLTTLKQYWQVTKQEFENTITSELSGEKFPDPEVLLIIMLTVC